MIKHVAVKLFADSEFALVKLNDDAAETLEGAPVDVELRDGVALFPLSKFLRCEIEGDPVDVGDANGSGWANIKIRHAEYDYVFKKKKGHTSKLELLGINFLTFKAYEDSTELADSEDDEILDGVDLPF